MSVYSMGGPNSAIEKSYQLRIANLNRDVEKISKKISNVINKGLTTTETNISFWKGLSNELEVEYKALYSLYRDWGSTNIPAAYKDSLTMVNKQIFKMANVANKARLSVEQIMSTRITSQFTKALYEDALLSWGTGLNTGKMNMERLLRMTRQSLIEESLFDTTLAEAIEGGNVRAFSDLLASKNPPYKKLLNAAKEERFIEAGSRKYSPEYYAEMVSRVKFHEAQSQAAKTQALNYDTDLLVVSTHNTQTQICQAFEGKIFSISGKDTRFPKLQETAPYHTNCIHLMFPQFESALQASGTLKQFSDFSKGKVDKPPYPAGFVPVDKRVVTKPVVTKPVVTKPAVTKPVVTKPAVTKPVVTKPAVTKPVVTKPVVTKPAVTKPVVTKPVVTKQKYTSVEKNTLDSYGKNDYKDINSYLRYGTIKSNTSRERLQVQETMNKRISTIDTALSKNILSKDTLVYRGASGFENPKALVGSTIISKGFSSTSTSLSTAKSFSGMGNDSVIFKIKAPKGTNYVSMKQFESGSTIGENEVLFGRDKQLKITGFSEEKVGDVVLRTILEGEYI